MMPNLLLSKNCLGRRRLAPELRVAPKNSVESRPVVLLGSGTLAGASRTLRGESSPLRGESSPLRLGELKKRTAAGSSLFLEGVAGAGERGRSARVFPFRVTARDFHLELSAWWLLISSCWLDTRLEGEREREP